MTIKHILYTLAHNNASIFPWPKASKTRAFDLRQPAGAQLQKRSLPVGPERILFFGGLLGNCVDQSGGREHEAFPAKHHRVKGPARPRWDPRRLAGVWQRSDSCNSWGLAYELSADGWVSLLHDSCRCPVRRFKIHSVKCLRLSRRYSFQSKVDWLPESPKVTAPSTITPNNLEVSLRPHMEPENVSITWRPCSQIALDAGLNAHTGPKGGEKSPIISRKRLGCGFCGSTL